MISVCVFSSVTVCAISPAQQILFTGCSRRPSNQKLRFKDYLVGGVQYFFCFIPIPGKMIQFDEHIFQKGLKLNRQLVMETTEQVLKHIHDLDHDFLHLINDYINTSSLEIISKICIIKFGYHQSIYTKSTFGHLGTRLVSFSG